MFWFTRTDAHQEKLSSFLPFAAAGLFLCGRRKREITLLLLYLTAYLIINLLFFSASEYRFPMILALLPLAASFFVNIFRELRERRFLRIAGALGIYLIVLVVANFPSRLRAELTNPSLDFFNLGSEEEVTVKQLAERVIALSGSAAVMRFLSYEKAYAQGFEDMRRRAPSIEKARRFVGYQPKYSLDDILREVIEEKRRETGGPAFVHGSEGEKQC